jgi:predicted amidohydrolase YtcJ
LTANGGNGVARRTADVVLVGGKVWPGLGALTSGADQSGIAIADGRILDVGDRERLDHLIDEESTIVDVGGRRIVPGLVDSHLHAVRAGLSYLDELDWTDIRSLPAALASVRAAAHERVDDTWITVRGGWHPSQLAENRTPTRAELDQAAPDHPVFVHPLYGHDDVAVLNTRALAAMGWDEPVDDPDGCRLFRNPDGRPDGRLTGLAGYELIGRHAAVADPARERASTTAFFRRLAAFGLTGVIDAAGLGMDPSKYRAVRQAWREGELPIRVRLNLGAVTRGAEAAEIARWREYLDPGLGDDMLCVLGIGEVIHFGCHDWEGMTRFDISDADLVEFTSTLRMIARSAWPLTLHAILDTSATRILDAVETVAAEIDLEPLRWSLCHVEGISVRNLERVRQLGLGLTVQSRMVHKARIFAERWGDELLRSAPPLGDIRRLGIPFGAGTDGTRSASYNPWQALWWFVSGRTVDGGPRRDERHRLDRATALDAYTRGSTWFSFEESSRGVLTPGAHADLAVLSEDYFIVPEDEIPTITSDLTLVAGRVVHAAGGFAGAPVESQPARPSAPPAPTAAAIGRQP